MRRRRRQKRAGELFDLNVMTRRYEDLYTA
jgi:hypothetical protein